MTLLSKCILAGYVILHILFILLLDRQLTQHFRSCPAYQKIRRAWITLFAAAAAVPAAATFLPEEGASLFLQRIGNVFLAFDLHIAGLFLLVTLFSGFVFFFTRSRSADSRVRGDSPRFRSSRKLPLWLLILILAAGTAIPLYGLHHAQDTAVRFFQADLRSNSTSLTADGAGLTDESTAVSGTGENLPETGDAGRELRIALIADLHLSVNSHLQTVQNMVRLINEQEPDIVLVAGDVFTSSYAALRDPEKYAEALSGIHAPEGVFAVYGNHDVEETLFGGFAVHPVSEAFRTEQIEQFFRDCGFTVLCDQSTSIADGTLLLAGRIDGNKAGDGTKDRLAPAELLKDADSTIPVLVLEHEPVEYEKLREAGADMVLSGHTHNGQIFPGNVYVSLVNENGYGQKTLYGMETFVTSGMGTFGPPMRTGTDSEIMIIDVRY